MKTIHPSTIIETSSKTKESQSFLDSLALLSSPLIYDTDTPPLLVETLKEASPYIRKHQLGVSTWAKLIKLCSNDYYTALESIDALAETIYVKHKMFIEDSDLSKLDVDFIRNWQLWWRRESNAGLRFIVLNVGKVCSSNIPSLFAGTSTNLGKEQQSILKKLQRLTFSVTGRRTNALDLEQAKQLRLDDPELYKQYLALRRDSNSITKTAVQQIVRSSLNC